MFIVLPFLSSDPNIFGIYTVCISINIFLSYADLGFISAGQKFAAEQYARNDLEGEIKIIGFSAYILFILVLIFSVFVFIISLNPSFIFKNINNTHDVLVASKLLQILSISTIINFLQRVGQIIYSIRLEDYIPQRISLFANFLRIGSVFVFFNSDNYDIVGFYLFFQIVNFLASVIVLYFAHLKFNYNFKLLGLSFRFDSKIFLKTYKLALTSFFVMITWVLYYELDQTVIGKYIGVKEVAIYGIGVTILSFFRGIFGIIYAPINTRFNHFIGIGDFIGLKNYYYNIIVITAPLVVIPIVTIFIGLKPLILSWLGSNYLHSIRISEFLILCNIFAFISYPAGMLLVAFQKVKYLNFIAFFLPIIFWLGVYLSYPILGIISFSVLKLAIFFILFLFYLTVTIFYLKESVLSLFKNIFLSLLLPIIFNVTVSVVFFKLLSVQKSKLSLLFNLSAFSVVIISSFLVLYFTSKYHRDTINLIIRKVYSK
jgi:O-antigen/teichoic acid export membrane protein